MITEIVFEKCVSVIKEIVETQVNERLSKKQSKPIFRLSNLKLENKVKEHWTFIESWGSNISFADAKKTKKTRRVYIELDVYIIPRRTHFSKDEETEAIEIGNVFHFCENHIVILGQPGAGKTTSAKYIALNALRSQVKSAENIPYTPIVVRFQDLALEHSDSKNILLQHIWKILGLREQLLSSIDSNILQNIYGEIELPIVADFLEKTHCLLILDGLDEVSREINRTQLVSEIENLGRLLKAARILLTSRTGEYFRHIANTDEFEIRPLTQNQILRFAYKWFDDAMMAGEFLEQIKPTPYYDATVRPLTIAHLCAIFERIKRIPEKPKSVYRKAVNLLIEEWDEQRGILRTSRFGLLEPDRKFEFLSHLAFALAVNVQRNSYSHDELESAYLEVADTFALPKHESRKVVNEIESHTGLMIQSGYDEFQFAHKSIQEFLTAEFLIRSPFIDINTNLFSVMPNEIAIAVALSARPTEFLTNLIFGMLAPSSIATEAIFVFVYRLTLEMPDLSASNDLCIALAVLYSHSVRDVRACVPFNKVQIYWTYQNTFKELFKMIHGNLNFSFLETYYEVVSFIDQYSFTKAIRNDYGHYHWEKPKKVGMHNQFKRKSIVMPYRLPSELFLPDYFLSKRLLETRTKA